MVKIAHASSDENGRISGGKAGDQTGRETRIQNWYANNWHYVIRFLKPEMREKFAKAMEDIANNPNVGYAQDDRNTLLKEAEKVGWDISKIKTPCEADCSSAVTVACICAGVPKNALYVGGNCASTRTLRARLNNTGLVEVTNDAKFVGSDKYALRGDIYLKENVHVVAVISNGELAQPKEEKPAQPQTTTTTFALGQKVKLKAGATYYDGKTIPSWVFKKELYVRSIGGDRIVISTLATGAVTGAVKASSIEAIGAVPTSNKYMVKVTTTALNIRSGPGTNYRITGCIRDKGCYTIVEESGTWGKLLSGAGWISLKYTKRV